MTRSGLIASGGLAVMLAIPGVAGAQISNQPFQFNGGMGMSDAARSAIVNQQVFGVQPEIILKDEYGNLLNVEKGPGGVPIVTTPGGALLTRYKGPSWKGNNRV